MCLGCGSLRGLFLSLEMVTGAQGAVWMGRTTGTKPELLLLAFGDAAALRSGKAAADSVPSERSGH